MPEASEAIIIDMLRIGDDLSTLCSKLTAIENVITARQSIAKATAYSAVSNQKPRSIRTAVDEMCRRETEAWACYQKGSFTLPDINWKTDPDLASQLGNF